MIFFIGLREYKRQVCQIFNFRVIFEDLLGWIFVNTELLNHKLCYLYYVLITVLLHRNSYVILNQLVLKMIMTKQEIAQIVSILSD